MHSADTAVKPRLGGQDWVTHSTGPIYGTWIGGTNPTNVTQTARLEFEVMTQQDPYQPVEQPQPAQQPYPAPTPGTQPTAAATGLAMKRRHPVTVWLLWPLITLGIYHLVWYYKIHKEMAEFDRRRTVPVVGPMLVLLLLSWTIIAPLISYYNAGSRIRTAQRAAGLPPSCSPVIGLLLTFVFGANIIYYQFELNKIVDRYGVPEGTQIQLVA